MPLQLASSLGHPICAALLVLRGAPLDGAAGTPLQPMLERVSSLVGEGTALREGSSLRGAEVTQQLTKASLLASSPLSMAANAPDYAAQAAAL